MKVLLLRIGALGAVVVLGWITFANAQRGSDSLPAGDSPGGSLTVREGFVRPEVTPPTGDVNPLRPATPPTVQAYPPSAPPAADPFGLQARRKGDSMAAAASPLPSADSIPDAAAVGLSSRYPQTAVAVSAEQPAAGPALLPGDANRPRYADQPDRTASRAGGRYPAPAAADGQEPAPLKIDPFATPASPMRQPAVDSGRAAESGTEGEGTGQPGAKEFEGMQSPQLSIQKLAPAEIQVGKPASFSVTVRNTGRIPASEVEIRDLVPKGTRLLGTTPQANRGPRGEIIWTLGTIRPGEEWTGKMELMPTAEGEIGSVATVHFGADASASTKATRPQLAIETTGPQKVLIGDQAVLTITISNPGSGAATGVVLDERIPPGLRHSAGTELEYQVGDLKPGESRKLELPLVADRAGPTTNRLTARGDGNLHAEDRLDLEVLAPRLAVAMEGPKRRYLERQATYQLSVSNPGTAPAKQVELIANLPPGLKFVSANNAGYYEESSRTVRWRLEELPANETGSVELVTVPVETSSQPITIRSTAQKGLAVEKQQPVTIEGIAAILFQVADTEDPIGIGGQTTYEVHVVNQGTKAAANVRLAVDLPPELKPVTAEGPARYAMDGNRVVFDGLASLAPKADTTYRIRVKAIRAGDLRARFQLLTDDMQSPVSKEESTRVYADE